MRRQQADTVRARKERERVMRFLATGAAVVQEAAGGGKLLLDGGERGTIAATAAILAALKREGLVVENGGALALSVEGRAHARRGERPDEPFRGQHMEIGACTLWMVEGPQVVQANLSESPLIQLVRRRTRGGAPFLDEVEFRAGERLRADYTRGRIMPRLNANWDAAVARGRREGNENGIAELTDAALAARQRVDAALAAVGPELAGLLVDVCCFLKGLERVESERGWPARSAKVVLKTALAALARHYEPRPRRRAIVHWGASGYRPRLHTRS